MMTGLRLQIAIGLVGEWNCNKSNAERERDRKNYNNMKRGHCEILYKQMDDIIYGIEKYTDYAEWLFFPFILLKTSNF